jgi:multidrug efflux pump subunit AcrA (membrane-fusion protein)
MTEEPSPASGAIAALLGVGHRARHAASAQELQFMAVNDSHELAPYRQAALWRRGGGVACLSGVVQVEANIPYVLWLNTVCLQFADQGGNARRVGAAEITGMAADEWREWLPAHGLWLPFPSGGLLLARDLPWTDGEIALLAEWQDTWHHAWQAQQRPQAWSWARLRASWSRAWQKPAEGGWWRLPAVRWVLGLSLVALLPVKLSILAPGELVPANPAVIRAPLDGVIDAFHVQPNQTVKKEQPLFGFDEALLRAKHDVTQPALSAAETEYRQAAQQALADSRTKSQLALLTGKIEEKRAEDQFVQDQLARARVLAPQDGIVLCEDPSEWIGRPVMVGERIMRIAMPGDVEIEAWVPLADAIPLPEKAPVTLYLAANPLKPVAATVRYLAHDATERPDGTFAYRLRATLDATTDQRIGLKGTVRLAGGTVPLIYWVLRRPIASIRSTIGW